MADEPAQDSKSPADENGSEFDPYPTEGLKFTFWPAWVPHPAERLFVPSFRVVVAAEKGPPKFETSVGAENLLAAIERLCHLQTLMYQTVKNFPGAKIQIFSTQDSYEERLRKIISGLEEVRREF